MSASERVLTITGGASGIGIAVARRFAAHGTRVLILGRNKEKGRAAELLCGPCVTFMQCDVSDPHDVKNTFAEIDARYGGINLAVNNAGVTTPYCPVAEVSVEDWKQTMSINLDGVFHCMKYQIPLISRKAGGAIVNVSSCAGVVPIPMQSAYVTSKAAVNALTCAVALEYAIGRDGSHPVRINSVAPGPTLGGMNTPERLAANPENTERKKRLTAMRRFGEPDEIADVIEWLLSTQSSFVTGQIISPDGGYNTGKVL